MTKSNYQEQEKNAKEKRGADQAKAAEAHKNAHGDGETTIADLNKEAEEAEVQKTFDQLQAEQARAEQVNTDQDKIPVGVDPVVVDADGTAEKNLDIDRRFPHLTNQPLKMAEEGVVDENTKLDASQTKSTMTREQALEIQANQSEASPKE